MTKREKGMTFRERREEKKRKFREKVNSLYGDEQFRAYIGVYPTPYEPDKKIRYLSSNGWKER